MKVTFKQEDPYGWTGLYVDGEKVGVIRKRREVYSGMRRGGIYTYFDVYDHSGVGGTKIASDSVRRRAVAEALVALGRDEAARTVDSYFAKFQIEKRARS